MSWMQTMRSILPNFLKEQNVCLSSSVLLSPSKIHPKWFKTSVKFLSNLQKNDWSYDWSYFSLSHSAGGNFFHFSNTKVSEHLFKSKSLL